MSDEKTGRCPEFQERAGFQKNKPSREDTCHWWIQSDVSNEYTPCPACQPRIPTIECCVTCGATRTKKVKKNPPSPLYRAYCHFCDKLLCNKCILRPLPTCHVCAITHYSFRRCQECEVLTDETCIHCGGVGCHEVLMDACYKEGRNGVFCCFHWRQHVTCPSCSRCLSEACLVGRHRIMCVTCSRVAGCLVCLPDGEIAQCLSCRTETKEVLQHSHMIDDLQRLLYSSLCDTPLSRVPVIRHSNCVFVNGEGDRLVYVDRGDQTVFTPWTKERGEQDRSGRQLFVRPVTDFKIDPGPFDAAEESDFEVGPGYDPNAYEMTMVASRSNPARQYPILRCELEVITRYPIRSPLIYELYEIDDRTSLAYYTFDRRDVQEGREFK